MRARPAVADIQRARIVVVRTLRAVLRRNVRANRVLVADIESAGVAVVRALRPWRKGQMRADPVDANVSRTRIVVVGTGHPVLYGWMDAASPITDIQRAVVAIAWIRSARR